MSRHNMIAESMDVDEAPRAVRQRVSAVVLPGDAVTQRLTADSSEIKIGHGIELTQEDCLVVNVPGELITRTQGSWVESSHRRYFPRMGDRVVGIVEDMGGDFYTVNIFSGTHCILNRLAFEGATKRNKPELKKGDVVYAIVQVASKDRETELSCVNASGPKKEWSSGETVYGPLNQGLLINVSTGMARRLLRPDCAVVLALGRHFTYEQSVGLNGAVWIRCEGSPVDLIVIRNAILNAEMLDDAQAEAMVETLVSMSAKARRRATN